MQIILLQRIPKLGQMGDTVRVRDGYARNFLLPQGKAIRATEANREHFEAQRAQLEARNLEEKKEAEAVAGKLDGQSIVVIRQASERGQLYGSVSTRDIAEALTESGFNVARGQVELNAPIKTLGITEVPVRLHPEVTATVVVNIARTADEAERQARGEDTMAPEDEAEEALEEALADTAEFFEDEALAEEAAQAAAESVERAPESEGEVEDR
jgi:large subunit ribosomal protein L9